MNIYICERNRIIVEGQLQGIDDYSRLTETIGRVVDMGAENIELHFRDAAKLASSVIGYLVKLRAVNQINVVVSVADKKLYDLLTNMGIADTINAELSTGQSFAQINHQL